MHGRGRRFDPDQVHQISQQLSGRVLTATLFVSWLVSGDADLGISTPKLVVENDVEK